MKEWAQCSRSNLLCGKHMDTGMSWLAAASWSTTYLRISLTSQTELITKSWLVSRILVGQVAHTYYMPCPALQLEIFKHYILYFLFSCHTQHGATFCMGSGWLWLSTKWWCWYWPTPTSLTTFLSTGKTIHTSQYSSRMTWALRWEIVFSCTGYHIYLSSSS